MTLPDGEFNQMRSILTIATLSALIAATACSKPEIAEEASSNDSATMQAPSAPFDASSSTAVYLECKGVEKSATEPVIIYRIDPVELTWSEWVESEEEGGPDWRIILCDQIEDACTFSDTSYALHVGMDVMGLVNINRVTGKMTKRKYSEKNGLQEWTYSCAPTDNPVEALGRKF